MYIGVASAHFPQHFKPLMPLTTMLLCAILKLCKQKINSQFDLITPKTSTILEKLNFFLSS